MPTSSKEYQREYRLKNKDKLKEYHKVYRQTHKNDIKNNKLRYYTKHKEKILKKMKDPTNRNNLYDWQLRSRYGITLEQYQQMFNNQNGKCAICGVHQVNLTRKLAVDHCHTTEKIRKLLCSNCNTGLGMFKHNQIFLQSAIEYLRLPVN